MKKYNFKTTNTFLIFLRLFLALSATLIIIILLSKYSGFGQLNNEFVFLTCFVALALLFFYFLRKIIVIDTIIKIESMKIEITCKHLLIKSKPKIIPIDEIRNYSYDYGNGYKVFKLTRKKGNNFKFLIMTEVANATQFDNFYADLQNIIKQYNYKKSLNLISEKKSIYQTRLGLILGFALSFVLLTIPIIHLLFDTKFNIGLLVLIYSMSITFLIRLFYEQKK